MLSRALGLADARLVSLCGAGGKTTLMFALAREFVTAGERVLLTTTTKIAHEEAAGAWRSYSATSAEQVLERARGLWAGAEPGERGALVAFSGTARDARKLTGFAPDLVNALKQSGEFDRILVEADGSARKPLKAPAAHEPVIPSATDAVIAVAGLNGLGLPLRDANVFRAEIWAQRTGTRLGTPVTAEAIASMALHPDGFFKGCPASAQRILFLNRADTPERLVAAMHIVGFLASSHDRAPDRVARGRLIPSPEVTSDARLVAAESGHP